MSHCAVGAECVMTQEWIGLTSRSMGYRDEWQKNLDDTYRNQSRYGAASSPALTRDSVIVMRDGERAGDEDIGWLVALDRSTGEERWRVDLVEHCCTYTSPLVVDRGAGEEVWVAISGTFTSYDAESGEALWSTDYEINQLVSKLL